MSLDHEQFLNKCKFLNENFLHLCYNKTVLEIGCFDGPITNEVIKHNPKSLVLLEANKIASDVVRERFPLATVIHGDMHADLNQVGTIDIALVLGVIYHSHSPLLVLEELVNCCDPQDIVLDIMSPTFEWHPELVNSPGMRHTTVDKKTCNIVITIDNKLTITAMTNLGYQLITQTKYPENSRAQSCPIFHFSKNKV
jgi:SAM-dependent methyltransferase